MRVELVFIFILVACSVVRAEEAETNKQQRLDFIRTTLARFEVETVDDTAKQLTLSVEPALWYTNPVRSATGTGATFFWLDGVRPVAAVSASIRDSGRVFRETSLLQDVPLRATRDGKLVWSPKRIAKPWAILPDAPQPGKNDPQRLIQMRAIVRRFEARLLKGDMEPGELRALSRPIYRYTDPAVGIVDGVVFGLVEATDPEALLLLEAHADDAGGSWQYTIARMTSRPSEVRLDGRELWETDAYWKNPRSKEDPYMEAYDSQYEADVIEVRGQESEVSR
ncbi:MAG: hypothetical protein H8E66_01255 [Planctomycetes bacterium]|nr:hypothetical protein [Planctomycetota bacterium]